jgi:outer membrane protein
LAEPLKNDKKDFSLRLGTGHSDFNNLGQIIIFDFDTYEGHTHVSNIDGGWLFSENMQDLPFDWYLKGGLSYFDENGLQDNFFEATLYVKVYYKLDFIDNRIRIGFGEGLSWASHVPICEIVEATIDDGKVAKLLNYLDISADFDLGRLINVDSLDDLYIGYTIKHRSGVFGLFSGVKGGSNYQMFTVEKNF